MTDGLAVTLAALVLADEDLWSISFAEHLRSDGCTDEVGETNLRSTGSRGITNGEHLVEDERGAIFGIVTKVDVNEIALLNFDLGAAVFDDRVHSHESLPIAPMLTKSGSWGSGTIAKNAVSSSPLC